ncbi:MAG TPA: hypothetical protein VJU59_10345 [Paraburkholderia sp.]|uniref:hypothetical protein n=1 Tax=Paraburkholderia sp. TaxID=1926495 RepID=UPI002B464FB7|nr:hypothetical protein [Paraburkholderia sp.]HKR40056.1 hypothetical protein [Paraburkholderia sp.]
MKISKSTAAGLAASGIVCMIATQRFDLPSLLGVAGLFSTLYGAARLLRIVESDRNIKAINSALANVDLMHGGLHVIGRDAESVDWRRADNPGESGPIEVVQLGKTQAGQWFEHRFALRYGRTYGYSIRFLDQSEARAWMSYDVKAYERVFGHVTVV